MREWWRLAHRLDARVEVAFPPVSRERLTAGRYEHAHRLRCLARVGVQM
jgi:hypothetical protein